MIFFTSLYAFNQIGSRGKRFYSIKEVTTIEGEKEHLDHGLLLLRKGDQMLHNEMYWKTSRKL